MFSKPNKLTQVSRLSLLVVVAALSLCVEGAARTQARINPDLLARAEQITGDRFTVIMTTPRGVNVVALTPPKTETLDAIDRGFAELFAVARRHGYRSRLSFNDYTVFIARADRTKDSQGQYSPDIAVPAGQYAGGYYDQGGFIYAAGMVLAFNPCAFIIAEHAQNLGRITDVVRYEGEHIILYYNDRALYEKTADHSRGGGHPILQ